MNSKKLSQLVVVALDDLKGESIRCINVKKLTSITDYMVIATGRSNTHIRALGDTVVKKVKESGLTVVGVEGRLQSEWMLVDVGDVVVHIMLSKVRALYNLEDLWNFHPGDADTIKAKSGKTRARHGSAHQLRLDANRGLDPGELGRRLDELSRLGPELLEEPVPWSEWPQSSPVPLALDETLGRDWADWPVARITKMPPASCSERKAMSFPSGERAA